jgi:uncharacterized protein (DUF697 family)
MSEKNEETTAVEVTNEEQANKLVKNYMWWSMGAGLIPFPLIDLAAVTGVQIKMLKDVSDIYDIEFSQNRGKSIVSGLIGSIVPNTLSHSMLGSLFKVVPFIGTISGSVSMAVFSGAATYAIGKVFIQHFEAGGTFLNFNPSEVKEYFKKLYLEGEEMAKKMKDEKGK